MSRYEQFIERMKNGELIMIDGATGTECERRGIPLLDNAWNGGGALSHPEIVRQVHLDYLDLGAQLVISNTFATNLHALTEAGEGDRFDDYNRRGVELAIEARTSHGNESILVAGGISYWSWSGNHPTLKDLRNSIERQATVMADAGADLLMLEMMIDIHKMKLALEAARLSGLPVWVGLSCEPDENGVMCLMNGEPLADTIDALDDYEVPLISIMHTPCHYIEACLDIVDEKWDGLVGVYPDTGEYEDDAMLFDTTLSPEQFRDHAQKLVKRRINLIGCCCGMGVDHLRALREVMN